MNRIITCYSYKKYFESCPEMKELYMTGRLHMYKMMSDTIGQDYKTSGSYLMIPISLVNKFLENRKRFLLSDKDVRVVDPDVSHFVTFPGGIDEVICVSRGSRYVVDLDCKTLTGTDDIFSRIYRFLGNYPKYEEMLHETRKGSNSYIDRDMVNRLEEIGPIFGKVMISMMSAIQESLKMSGNSLMVSWNSGRPDSGLMEPLTGPFTFQVKANHFSRPDGTGQILRKDKISMHIILTSVCMRDQWTARQFTYRVIYVLFFWYLLGSISENSCSIESMDGVDDMNNVQDVYRTIQTKFGPVPFEPLQIIVGLFDMGLYSSSHNLRMAYEQKGDEERYSVPVTKTNYHDFPTIGACLATIASGDPGKISDIFVESYSSPEQFGQTRMISTINTDDEFIISAINQVTESNPQFSFSHLTLEKGRPVLVNFLRSAPDHFPCPLCNRKHDSDNNLYLTIKYDDDTNSRTIFQNCRRMIPALVGPGARSIVISSESKKKTIDSSIESSAQWRPIDIFYSQAEFQDIMENSRYVQVSEKLLGRVPFGGYRGIFIHSGMGTGKTVQLMDYISWACKETDESFVSVSFRRTQANEMCSKYNECLSSEFRFANYQDRSIDFNRSRNFVIQVDSFLNIDLGLLKARKYVLVLDEIMSIIQQFDSEHVRKNGMGPKKVLFWLIGNAHRVVFMDAHMTGDPFKLFRACCEMYGSIPSRDEIFYLVNEYKSHEDYVYNLVDDKNVWLSALFYKLSRNKKCVVATSSKTKASEIYEAVSNDFPALRIKLYTSETSDSEKTRDFVNVNEAWKYLDILIYSPTMGAGISYDLETFDCLFGYFVSESCNAEANIQLLGRVRSFRSREAYIYCTSNGYQVPMNLPEIQKCLLDEYKDIYGLSTWDKMYQDKLSKRARRTLTNGIRNYIGSIIDKSGKWSLDGIRDPGNILEICIELQKNKSYASLMRRMIFLLRTMSERIRPFVPWADMDHVFFKGYEELFKEIHSHQLASCPVLSRDEYRSLLEEVKRGKELDATEKRSIKKRKFADNFTVDPGKMNHNFFKMYCFGEEKLFDFWAKVPNCHNVDESIKILSSIKVQANATKVLENSIMNKGSEDKLFVILEYLRVFQGLGLPDIRYKYNVPVTPEVINCIMPILERLHETGKMQRMASAFRALKDSIKKQCRDIPTRLCKILNNSIGAISGCSFSVDTNGFLEYMPNINFVYQENIFDREEHYHPIPKIMAYSELLDLYYPELFRVRNEYDDVEDIYEEMYNDAYFEYMSGAGNKLDIKKKEPPRMRRTNVDFVDEL